MIKACSFFILVSICTVIVACGARNDGFGDVPEVTAEESRKQTLTLEAMRADVRLEELGIDIKSARAIDWKERDQEQRSRIRGYIVTYISMNQELLALMDDETDVLVQRVRVAKNHMESLDIFETLDVARN